MKRPHTSREIAAAYLLNMADNYRRGDLHQWGWYFVDNVWDVLP